MRRIIPASVALAVAAAMASPPAAGDEPVAEKAAAAAETREFKPPDGWRPKKRGKYTLYCRKDYNVKGTRLPAEVCYDEAGIRAMLEAQREDQTAVDKMRRICGSDAACGAH